MSRVAGVWMSIAQRTMLLLVASVAGSLAVLAIAFLFQRQEDFVRFADAQARHIAAQVHSVHLILQSVPKSYRRGVSEGLQASGTLYALPAAEAAALPRRSFGQRPTPGGFSTLLGFGAEPSGPSPLRSEAIARYVAQPAEVRYAGSPNPVYWVSQQIDGELWWIVVLSGDPPPAPGGAPWPALVAVLAALLAVAVWYAATIARPLRRLAVATRRIGETWPEPVDITGPTELRDLGVSFNAMLMRLRQIESERRVLLGGLPHDLRAPLTRLRLRLAGLGEAGEQPGIVGDIAAIDRVARQFTEYLRGVQPDEPCGRIDQIAEAAVDSYRSLGRNVCLGGGSVQIAVPLHPVRRILDNLIDNALQHGREPVVVELIAAGSRVVEIVVTDQGGGVPREAMEVALEPFTKLDPARGQGGCGLGLAIVRQLTRQLGGGVRFEHRANSFSVVASIGVELLE
jgi:signal transduction histidine kinase